MTTRRWMMAAAIVVALLAAGLGWTRRSTYLALADAHAYRSSNWEMYKRPMEAFCVSFLL
jgi:hypothetical protein